MSNNFRELLPGPEHRARAGIAERDAYSHADRLLATPRGQAFVAAYNERLAQPFVGITCDGQIQPHLYKLEDNGAPAQAMLAAARGLLNQCSDKERTQLRFALDAPNWRMWSNPELYINRYGLRMDELQPPLREAILAVLRASLSQRGYEKARACMLMNEFLGQLVGGPRVLNQYSYNFSLFGEPSLGEPWGWQLHGHHLCLNCLVIGKQLIVSPTFMGAEPNVIDEGPHAGLTILDGEERSGLRLMQSLASPLRERAQIYKQMYDPAMPQGRLHYADERHLGGAFHDNRVIPYEGVRAAEMTAPQRDHLLALCGLFIEYLPEPVLAARMRELEHHLADTYFSWIGQYGDDDPYYFRVQSPVIMCEFDHHAGVFLTNREPAKCHMHTIVRTPNGNDYGKDILRQHYQHVHGVS